MIARRRLPWRKVVAAALVAAACSLATPAAAAGPTPATATSSVRATPPVEHGGADQSLRLDRQARVVEVTGYQTLLVAGVIGSAAVVGGVAAGASGAVTAGTAVLLLYLFMP